VKISGAAPRSSPGYLCAWRAEPANAEGTLSVQAVILDLDDMPLESERVWSAAKEQVTRQAGGTWRPDATQTVMGISSRESAR
jgi:hypothetical protein